MRKSNYITKYDYIGYYTKQPAIWFFTNAELEASLKLQNYLLNNNEDFDEEEYQDDAIDAYSIYQDKKSYDLEFALKENDKNQFLYHQFLENTKHIDDKNPIIIEGRLLDDKSKNFIKNRFNLNNDYHIIDFDDNPYKFKTTEALALLTKEAILNYPKLIMFQPTFIDDDLKITTKCDALVIDDFSVKLIETKGTSTTKIHHFLDLFYQKKILDKQSVLNKKPFELYLCVVKYEILSKREVSFEITRTFNLCKAVDTSNKPPFEKQQIKLGIRTNKIGTDVSIYLDDICNGFFDDEIFETSNNNFKKKEVLLNVINSFNNVIKKLWEHKNKLNISSYPCNFVPSQEDKGFFKNTDMWLQLKNLYSNKGYKLFLYSGNVVDQSAQSLESIAKEDPYNFGLNDYIKKPNKDPGKFENLFLGHEKENFQIFQEETQKIINTLKTKKVYFDFESINSAIRVIEKSYPFMQAVTQCSIIKDHGNGVKTEKCTNLVKDPNLIDNQWFKEIIDSLYAGPEYSYVVYNKAFEKSRLKEMAEFINEEEYAHKVKIINDNVFDLADLFTVTKQAIIIKELGGFHSIKKVLPIVQKYAPDFFEQTGCKDYKKLSINNGLMCQQKTAARFFGLLADEEWNQLVNDVSVYCENDVRAMIAVEYFALDLIKNSQKYNKK